MNASATSNVMRRTGLCLTQRTSTPIGPCRFREISTIPRFYFGGMMAGKQFVRQWLVCLPDVVWPARIWRQSGRVEAVSAAIAPVAAELDQFDYDHDHGRSIENQVPVHAPNLTRPRGGRERNVRCEAHVTVGHSSAGGIFSEPAERPASSLFCRSRNSGQSLPLTICRWPSTNSTSWPPSERRSPL